MDIHKNVVDELECKFWVVFDEARKSSGVKGKAMSEDQVKHVTEV